MPLTVTDVATDANETNPGIVYSYDISIVICLPLYRDRMKPQISLCSGAIKTWVCKYVLRSFCTLVVGASVLCLYRLICPARLTTVHSLLSKSVAY